MYKLIKRDGNAKRGEFHTVHGVIQTPVFMNVGTAAAIKGAVSTEDLQQIGTQVELIVQKAIIDKQYDIMQLNVTLFKYTNEILGV